ncbi:hypothetical protein L3049_06025 [Labilibaculum sp. DW002]|uniref:Glycosyltransferase subfamily 4-like N-terminal domain-containing protein n=1 Tax=Paralabilibaculum antarcticum TaxID=2912572 RepID=A0ABT5VQ58_9BACT|nr:hypothetical protein [Labilibaculum sp. DW002]MDE5417560.1 hypothetical protein [Labilibaculum sp. DW002]
MKIIFLCGSLEPGRDGVGDYSRRLAGELIRQGHQSALLALYDKNVPKILEEEQESEGISIPVLRISTQLAANSRFTKAKTWIDQFDPEWLSLQYVPFSFQKKGLPFGLASKLKKIGIGRKWQIMFHELWVGMDSESPFKYKVWGEVQKIIIHNIIAIVKPVKIHTQTRLYQAQLSRLGYKANYLPLFGNIPVIIQKEKKSSINEQLTFLLFGSIHPGAPIVPFVKELAVYGQNNNKTIHFQFIGRCGTELENWCTACENAGLKTEVLGEQSIEKISDVLSMADWGISSTPLLLIEKSGTAAAMQEHKLPIICVSRNWEVKNAEKTLNYIPYYKKGKLEKTLAREEQESVLNSLAEISQQLSNSLIKI